MEEFDTQHLFEHLAAGVQAKLRELLHARTYAAGEQIFLQGEPGAAIYLVAKGRVKISRVTAEGYESILCVRGPGEYFCPVPVLDSGAQLGTAAAMTDVTLLWAERDTFRALCEVSPELLSNVQGDCLAEVRQLLNRLEAFAFRNVRERLAIALLNESRRQNAEGGPPGELRLTQQDLAGLVGASRESVSRTLAQLEREGVVSLKRGRVLIRDWEHLSQLAKGRAAHAPVTSP